MDTKTGSTAPRKRGAPHIVVLTDLQVPHIARVAESTEPESVASGGMPRAQYRTPSHSISPGSGGSPMPLATSRTTDHFRASQHVAYGGYAGGAQMERTLPQTPPPSSWDEALCNFLSRFCSPHPFGLESLSIWHDEMAKIKTPTGMTREQWVDAEGYIKYLAQQLAANNALSGNLNWAMFHFVVHMRCLKTVDFLSDIEPALCSLQFVLRIMLKGLSLTLEDEKLRKVLVDRPIASGTIDLIVDKQTAHENGEVRIHAFKQTLADSSRLYQQLLHYSMLAIARMDVRRSHSQYVFYQDLIGMFLDMFVSQVSVCGTAGRGNTLVKDILETVGSSRIFNIESSLADESVRALLLNAIEASSAPTGQGLVQSAYSYLFSRQGAQHSKLVEQYSLYLLLLLISTRLTSGSKNPFLETFEQIKDTPDGSIAKTGQCGVPFRKLFGKLVSEIHCIEWTVVLQILVSRNDMFRTYALARTDADTLMVPLLKRITAATALPIPSSFGHSQVAAGGSSSAGAGTSSGSSAGGRKRSDSRHYTGSSSTYVTLVTEPSNDKSSAQSHRQPNSQLAGPWAYPTSPTLGSMSQGVQHSSKSATTASTVKSSPAKTHSAGANGSTTGASANATSSQSTTAAATASAASAMSVSVGQQLRQSALLPYALVPETVPYVHLYLWLDILLSLSSDAQFVEQLERTTIDFWAATPQPLHKPALSHCLIVESMRIFQLNIMLLKDSQIHALSLGILANVLGRSTHISTAITQKLLKLFEMIHKRYSKIATPSRPGEQSVDEHDEQGVYAQTLAVLLTLFCHLSFTNNAQFIYGLLQAREITGVFGVSPNGADGEAVERAARAAAELRVRVAYFHALVSALPSPQQAKDILSLVESVVAKGDADSVTRVDMVSRAPGDDEWSAFLLPLVWELLLSSNIATVAELRTQFLEEFENLVL